MKVIWLNSSEHLRALQQEAERIRRTPVGQEKRKEGLEWIDRFMEGPAEVFAGQLEAAMSRGQNPRLIITSISNTHPLTRRVAVGKLVRLVPVGARWQIFKTNVVRGLLKKLEGRS